VDNLTVSGCGLTSARRGDASSPKVVATPPSPVSLIPTSSFIHHFPILCALLCSLALGGQRLRAATGPTLQFDYGTGTPHTNLLGQFMYFVPLVSPATVTVASNPGNTQCARVVSFHCQTNGTTFRAVCEFDFSGTGWLRDDFDQTYMLQRRDKELKAGKVIAHQLTSISVQGGGSGTLEIEGTLTNGQPTVVEMRLRFNHRGQPSPVNIHLQDLALRHGEVCYENETIARVNTLTFHQKSPPKMEVTLASVKRADAGNGAWQAFVGSVKGAAANLLLPPLNITTNGQQTMMAFGRALATGQPSFTFPFAERLKP